MKKVKHGGKVDSAKLNFGLFQRSYLALKALYRLTVRNETDALSGAPVAESHALLETFLFRAVVTSIEAVNNFFCDVHAVVDE